MKQRFLKLKSWLLVSLMGALGLSSCHTAKEATATPTPDNMPQQRRENMLMYGVPTMDYRIEGRVIDTKGTPVPGIEVNMLENGMTVNGTTLEGDPERVAKWLKESAVTTDEKGNFTITDRGLPQKEVRLLVRDVDGEANGSYQDQLLKHQVRPEEVNTEKAQGWYNGEVNMKVEVKLN
jgi:putative lipoprotein (rSAM/lipoprotein system)